MARFFPTIDEIRDDQMEKHTSEELELLTLLSELDDSYTVYFQPHINFSHPDIVVEKASCGLIIIEICDWQPGSFTYHPGTRRDKFGYLTVSDRPTCLSTPFQQVQEYKNELYEVLCPVLSAEKIRMEIDPPSGSTSPLYGVVRTGVFFTTSGTDPVMELFGPSGVMTVEYGRKQYDHYTTVWTADDKRSLVRDIQAILTSRRYYTETIHKAISALMCVSEEWMEQTKPIKLTRRQAELAVCIPSRKTKVCGAAGSGKTLVVAQKAINAFRKYHTPVLILTYNITLRNYIKDKIAANSRDMSAYDRSRAFYLVHFDAFLPQMLRRYNLKGPMIHDYEDEYEAINWEA